MMSVNTFGAYTLIKKHDEAIMAPAIVTARQPYLLTKADEIGPLISKKKKYLLVRLKYRLFYYCVCVLKYSLPEHNVIPVISENIQDVYPFPSLNSFKNCINIIPNEYVIPSAVRVKDKERQF